MKTFKVFLSVLVAPVLFSCQTMENKITKFEKSAVGSCFKVSLFSGGKEVRTYYSDFVSTEGQSDGWYFKDKDGRFIRISGTVSIEEVPEKMCKQ